MFDSRIVGDKIDAIIQSKPDILVPVRKKAEHIVVLETFLFGKRLDDVSMLVENITTAYNGAQGITVIADRNSGINAIMHEHLIGASLFFYEVVIANR